MEVTIPIIPGGDDSGVKLNTIAQFVGSVNTDILWHVTQFYLMYNVLDKLRVSVAMAEMVYVVGKRNGFEFMHG